MVLVSYARVAGVEGAEDLREGGALQGDGGQQVPAHGERRREARGPAAGDGHRGGGLAIHLIAHTVLQRGEVVEAGRADVVRERAGGGIEPRDLLEVGREVRQDAGDIQIAGHQRQAEEVPAGLERDRHLLRGALVRFAEPVLGVDREGLRDAVDGLGGDGAVGIVGEADRRRACGAGGGVRTHRRRPTRRIGQRQPFLARQVAELVILIGLRPTDAGSGLANQQQCVNARPDPVFFRASPNCD